MIASSSRTTSGRPSRGTGGPALAVALAAMGMAGCTEPEDEAEVAVTWSWSHVGGCSDMGADEFRLTVQDGERLAAACEDDLIALRFPLGTAVVLWGELEFEGDPVTETLESPEFRVDPGGADVGFEFDLDQFFRTADFRFKAVFKRQVGMQQLDVDCSALDTQRVTLYDRATGAIVEGAQVCGPDAVCVPVDGSAGPCRDRDEEQTIPSLDWGRYRLRVEGEGAGDCYSKEVNIEVDYSRRTAEIVADLPCG